MTGSNLLFILTGSIAAAKACDVISRLVQRGHRVRCVATEAALRFVGPATLEGLCGRAPLGDLFAPGAALEHIELTRWADAVLVCPATANTINRLAAGLADDLPGALFLAHDRRKPWLVAPAMNPQMWSHPATAAAVARLSAWGVRFLPVADGRTACGELGAGRMIEPPEIVAAVEAALARPARRLRVLVTSGGTAEPIDGVRVLTNTSTGATGAMIAEQLARCGHDVTLLRARTAARTAAPVREETFFTFAELDAALTRLLAGGAFNAVIHAAAVSDYAVELIGADGRALSAGGGKLETAAPPLLRLKPNPKLVDTLRTRAGAPLRVVAFKLTHGASPAATDAAVRALFARAQVDAVVHNDVTARGATSGDFPATLHQADGATQSCATRDELAAALEAWLVGALAPEHTTPGLPNSKNETPSSHAPLS